MENTVLPEHNIIVKAINVAKREDRKRLYAKWQPPNELIQHDTEL